LKGKRRPTESIPILNPEEIKEVIDRASCPRDQCLVALLYLTGRRINEILPLRSSDFIIEKDEVSFTTFNEKSFRMDKQGVFNVEREVDFKYKNYKGVVYYEKIRPMFLKSSKSGRILSHYVLDYLKSLQDDEYLFPPFKLGRDRPYISSTRAYQILRKLDERLWLHALRHIDFTRLAEVYKDDPVSLHRLTFHRQFESTLNYIQVRKTKDRLKKL